MTEAEWRSCTDPQEMLQFLRESERASDRKLRLFACACCRRISGLFPDHSYASAVETVEQFADGVAGIEELNAVDAAMLAARDEVGAAALLAELGDAPPATFAVSSAVARAVLALTWIPDDRGYLRGACLGATEAAGWAISARCPDELEDDTAEKEAQCGVLRDLFNPFRTAPAIDPAWLTWNDSAVTRMATAIYEKRSLPEGTLDAQGLAVLADALEEAGCADEAILSHCRGPGPHVRGCWVLDGLLGKS
jgi:hypothetical protein